MTMFQLCNTIKELKKKHGKDVVVLIRDEHDFYVAGYKDAMNIGAICNLEVVDGMEENGTIVDIVSFKSYKLSDYLPKIIRAGYKVALCDPIK
jgi:DNA mismatch repair ATPase MutS